MTRVSDPKTPGEPTTLPVSGLQLRLSAVVGVTGTALIIASAVLCYLRFFYLPPGEGAIESAKAAVIVAVALFLSGAAALIAATQLHDD